jgi:predicted HAD superfamily Cof-like phosphohydrolase
MSARRSMNVEQQVRQFHETFGVPIGTRPALSDAATNLLRLKLIGEEYDELILAIEAGDIIATADALGDLSYVTYGAALTWGIPLDAVITEIHRSNMTKLGLDGKPIFRADGKILKGPNFEPPDLRRVIFPGLHPLIEGLGRIGHSDPGDEHHERT